jgi:hypothetical protein
MTAFSYLLRMSMDNSGDGAQRRFEPRAQEHDFAAALWGYCGHVPSIVPTAKNRQSSNPSAAPRIATPAPEQPPRARDSSAN